jgi:hypothetical protein
MNEGNQAMTYDVFMDAQQFHGVPGVAVRLGRALEKWGRSAAQPIDREALRREYDRQSGIEARMLQCERLATRHR